MNSAADIPIIVQRFALCSMREGGREGGGERETQTEIRKR
jgi:hypothetical protein